MSLLTLDTHKVTPFIDQACLPGFQEEIDNCHRMLTQQNGKGKDFLGWIDLPINFDPSVLDRIFGEAERIREIAEILVVIGIGGSYLGSRAIIEALSNPFGFFNGNPDYPFVIFAGNNLSESYHAHLLQLLDRKDYAVAVISKSGTTTEPAVAFRLIIQHLEKKYGKENARKRIVAITDISKGALRKMAGKEGYSSYIIPDDIGGRYSVLTPVGLFPVAVAGFNIRALLEGAARMREVAIASSDYTMNPCAMYAMVRNILYRNGKVVEVMIGYEPTLLYLIEWWKQLFGESEGKEGKGIFPAGVTFTSDLHSMGQYLQEGKRMLFETVISITAPSETLTVPKDPENLDGLNYLSGKRISEVNKMAEMGTQLAHFGGGVPNIRIDIPAMNENYLGQLLYFFEFSCALSGYMLGVNPFNQPGVEAYKNNMFALLGKPGFEKEMEELRKKI